MRCGLENDPTAHCKAWFDFDVIYGDQQIRPRQRNFIHVTLRFAGLADSLFNASGVDHSMDTSFCFLREYEQRYSQSYEPNHDDMTNPGNSHTEPLLIGVLISVDTVTLMCNRV